jgi:hypothetical protein
MPVNRKWKINTEKTTKSAWPELWSYLKMNGKNECKKSADDQRGTKYSILKIK